MGYFSGHLGYLSDTKISALVKLTLLWGQWEFLYFQAYSLCANLVTYKLSFCSVVICMVIMSAISASSIKFIIVYAISFNGAWIVSRYGWQGELFIDRVSENGIEYKLNWAPFKN